MLPFRHRRGVEVWLYSFLNRGARWGWVVNPTSRSFYDFVECWMACSVVGSYQPFCTSQASACCIDGGQSASGTVFIFLRVLRFPHQCPIPRRHSVILKEFYIFLTVNLGVILVNNQLDALFSMYLFHSSTCLGQPSAHHQEDQLYQYIIWYISFCVGDCPVCLSPDRHTGQSSTQNDIYQLMYWYNWSSWWWALGCSKHVEKWNKHIERVRHVGC
jgi:hypothetical protein